MLEALFADYPMDVDTMMRHLKKTAADAGLPFKERKKTYNSRLAQELGYWAESENRGDAFLRAAFKAYFADGKNLAKMPVLVDLAASVDLPRMEAQTVLRKRAFKAVVDADWSLAREKEITAVPTLFLDRDKLVGAQPYDRLERFMNAHGIKKRKET